MTNADKNEELLCRYFVGVVCDTKKFRSSRKIRQILPWIGFVIAALRFVDDLELQRQRQITFRFKQRQFKAKFQHAGLKSGIAIIEVLPGRGSPEGETYFVIRSLKEAEQFYHHAASILPGKAAIG